MGLTLFYRKILSGIATILLATLLFTLLFFILSTGEPESLLSVIAVVSYATVGVALYGLPVSILAEVLIPYKARTRWFYALLIHIGFVIVPYIVLKVIEPRLDTLYFITIIAPVAFLYWLMDEGLIRWKPAFKIEEKKSARLIYGICSGLVLLFSFSWVNEEMVENISPLARHNIPEGHEGWVYVFYKMEGEPKLEVKGDFRIINFNEDGVAKTSTTFDGSAISENQYFYVDEQGDRTAIPQSQIHYGPVSGYTGPFGNTEIDYEVEAYFIGTKEEFEESEGPNHSEFLPEPKPVREKYRFTLPKDFSGWVEIKIDPNSTVTNRTYAVDSDGHVTMPYEISSIVPSYDLFYYRDGENLTRIPEEYVSESYPFPEVTVFYVGPPEDFEPFKYEDYIKNSEENR